MGMTLLSRARLKLWAFNNGVKSAQDLGITPPEWWGLVAFAKNALVAKDRAVRLNGKYHNYNQASWSYSDGVNPTEHHCETAGCVAGYVQSHAVHTQGLADDKMFKYGPVFYGKYYRSQPLHFLFLLGYEGLPTPHDAGCAALAFLQGNVRAPWAEFEQSNRWLNRRRPDYTMGY